MKIECPNCGSNNLSKKGNKYVCNMCDYEIDIEYLEKKTQSQNFELNKFQSEMKEIFSAQKELVSKEELRKVLEDLSFEIKNNSQKDYDEVFEKFLTKKEEDYQEYLKNRDSIKDEESDSEKEKEYLAKIQITAKFLAEHGAIRDCAGHVYMNIEDNLIEKYKLPHKGTHFVITQEQYDALLKKCAEEKNTALMRWNKEANKLEPIKLMEYKGYLVMDPLVRFVSMGLSESNAKQAFHRWNFLNWTRHNSKENQKKLKKMGEKIGKDFSNQEDLKDYLLDTIKFFKNQKLYDLD